MVSLENLSDNFCRFQEDQLQWSNLEQQMDEAQGREDQAVLDNLIKEVPLAQSPANETVSVSAVPATQFSMATPVIDLVQSMPAPVVGPNVNEVQISAPIISTNVPTQSIASPEFKGFNFPIGDSVVKPRPR